MSITAVCHQCGSFATVPDSAAGAQCQCPNCGAKVQIPGGVAKLCCICKADVTNAPRTKDAAGNYYCAACGAKAAAAEQAAALAAAGLVAPCVLCMAPAAKSTLLNFDGQWVCQRCAGAEGLGRLSYRLRKARLSSLRVVYHCPRCRGELESALAEAGKPDACPQCGCDFEIPGRYEAFKAEQAKAVPLTTPATRTDQTPAAAPPATGPGFWRRYGCALLDSAAVGFASFLPVLGLYMGIRPGVGLLQVVMAMAVPIVVAAGTVAVAYFWVFPGFLGRTPGQAVGVLRIVNMDGSKMSWWKSLGRAFAYCGGPFLVLGAGYAAACRLPLRLGLLLMVVASALASLWCLADGIALAADQGQMQRSLHDRICATRVVMDRPGDH